MKRRIFTLFSMALIAAGLCLFAQSPEGSTGWDNLQPAEQLVLDMNFQEYPFFHSDENPDQGNSTYTEPEGVGYMDTAHFVLVPGSSDTIFLDYYQCAFAPDWLAAWAYADTVDMPAGMTPGFVEISRYYEKHSTVNGHFIIDLRQMEFVEVVQWSHSSCGGKRRGFTLEIIRINGTDTTVVDTLRAQAEPASISIGDNATNFDCLLSAYGMRWEDGVWDSDILLRFTKSMNYLQAVRLHDLRVYGIPKNSNTSVNNIQASEIGIICTGRVIRLSETADIGIYSLSGALLKRADRVDHYAVTDLPDGMYIVRARTESQTTTNRILIK